MNVQATHGLPAGDLRQLDALRQNCSATEGPALPLVRATSREFHLAIAVVIISVLALTIVVPFARVPLPKITAFIPSYESAMAVCDLVTAVLLFGRAARSRSLAFLALASGYLFNAIIIVVHALTFPGVFSDTGLLGANDQTTGWLYVFWHGGFPLFILVYALLPERDIASAYLLKHTGWAIMLSLIGVVAVVAALILLATVGHDVLPTIIQTGNYSLMISTGVSPTVLALSALALFALLRRHERTVLDVWLMVVMSIWLLDVTLSAVVSSSRYDLGWYVGRSYGLVAACCLLIILLFEMNRLYNRLNVTLAIAQALELDLTFRAENDSLTGLPNRALFYDRLAMAMTRCRRSKNLMALLYVDIDNFKKINDSLGHAAGDDLLRSFARRLLQCVRASDTVARLGGDEFTVILENLSSRETAQSVVDKLMAALRRPFETSANDIQARASIGIAYFTDEAIKADGLIKQADAALYRAKQRGRNDYSIYVPEGVQSVSS
jgi:diguanylate cyclase (GGDEF)-like protein